MANWRNVDSNIIEIISYRRDEHYFILHLLLLFYMSYSRVPESFMPGIFFQPHNFSDPENPQHGEYVHMQLRNDMYFSTL